MSVRRDEAINTTSVLSRDKTRNSTSDRKMSQTRVQPDKLYSVPDRCSTQMKYIWYIHY